MGSPADDGDNSSDKAEASTSKTEPDKKADKLKADKSKKVSDDSDSKKYEKTEPPNSKRAKQAKAVVKKLKVLSGGEYGLGCKKTEVLFEGTEKLVYALTCKGDDTTVAVAEDKYDRDAYIDVLDEQFKDNRELYILVDGNTVIASSDHDSINTAWDALGAEGKRKTVGSMAFS